MSPVLKRDMTGVLWVRVCVVLQMCLSAVLPASSSPVKNYYDRLNVEPTATDNQIKDNFRKLAMKYHPDKSKSVDAETKFREIAEAYHVLSNEKKRSVYDSLGHEAFLNNDGSVDPGDGHSDDFSFSFADLFHDIDVDLFAEEPYFHWSFQQTRDDVGAGIHYDSTKDPVLSSYFGVDNEDDDRY